MNKAIGSVIGQPARSRWRSRPWSRCFGAPGERAGAVIVAAVALLLVGQPAVAATQSNVDVQTSSASFDVIRGNEHLEFSGGPEAVPAILEAIESLATRDGENAPPVFVFINWQG